MSKIIEKFLPETRRLNLFRILYSSLFIAICIFLVFRQVFQISEFETKERKQGQRRIIQPGRGDVIDRNGELLIGNRASFAAVLHIEQLKEEIWQSKVKLRRLAYEIRNELNQQNTISLNQLISRCYKEKFVRHRKISINGKKISNIANDKSVKIIHGKTKLGIQYNSAGNWSCLVPVIENSSTFSFENTERIEVNVAGLFLINFELDELGVPKEKI